MKDSIWSVRRDRCYAWKVVYGSTTLIDMLDYKDAMIIAKGHNDSLTQEDLT